ncbi:MAG: hypothetical protein Q9212_000492 [Teloschistes hypoglaucus]
MVSRHERPSATSQVSKASIQSPTSSFEADDEESLIPSSITSSISPMDQEDEPCILEPPSRYADEDTRTTSKKELWGWYSYGFAAEVFVVCGIGKRMVISTMLSNWQLYSHGVKSY